MSLLQNLKKIDPSEYSTFTKFVTSASEHLPFDHLCDEAKAGFEHYISVRSLTDSKVEILKDEIHLLSLYATLKYNENVDRKSFELLSHYIPKIQREYVYKDVAGITRRFYSVANSNLGFATLAYGRGLCAYFIREYADVIILINSELFLKQYFMSRIDADASFDGLLWLGRDCGFSGKIRSSRQVLFRKDIKHFVEDDFIE